MLAVIQMVRPLYRQKQILPYVLLGGKVLYRESDLQGILQRNYVPASRHIH